MISSLDTESCDQPKAVDVVANGTITYNAFYDFASCNHRMNKYSEGCQLSFQCLNNFRLGEKQISIGDISMCQKGYDHWKHKCDISKKYMEVV